VLLASFFGKRQLLSLGYGSSDSAGFITFMLPMSLRIRQSWLKGPQCIFSVFLLFVSFIFGGCDAIYGILQKEGAEEKELLGEAVPFEANPRIAEVQRLLKLYGYTVGGVDGVMGAHTRKAIEEFQRDNDLKPSRFVDYATWDMLHVFEGYGLVRKGELNIAAVQKALKASGLDPGKIDGKFGRRTQEAIIAFQKNFGLKPDGKVGFKTLWELASYLPFQEDN
jgi:N-acetyl-anhydromuramyl-L-alanine amidase AmpD